MVMAIPGWLLGCRAKILMEGSKAAKMQHMMDCCCCGSRAKA